MRSEPCWQTSCLQETTASTTCSWARLSLQCAAKLSTGWLFVQVREADWIAVVVEFWPSLGYQHIWACMPKSPSGVGRAHSSPMLQEQMTSISTLFAILCARDTPRTCVHLQDHICSFQTTRVINHSTFCRVFPVGLVLLCTQYEGA